jgi:arsenical pump membrane protein
MTETSEGAAPDGLDQRPGPLGRQRAGSVTDLLLERCPRLRFHYVPAAVVLVLFAAGVLGTSQLSDAAGVMWRPLVTIASIMVTATAVNRLGVLDRVAAALLPRARGSLHRLFVLVFLLSGATAAVLNNDAAVLLLVPIVVATVRRSYPDDPGIIAPFALAVFMAAGVAPFVVSNPMNMIVAEYVGVGFNAYALRMVPIALVGSVVALFVLHRIFRRQLDSAPPIAAAPVPGPWTRRERQGLVLLVGVFGAYPLVASLGSPVYAVAVAGALAGVLLCRYHDVVRPRALMRHGISWEILVFLAGLAVLAVGLRDLGASRRLASLYRDSGVVEIGLLSAAGSAVLNNHPMSLLNMLALEVGSRQGLRRVLAALIGGDLGPRLLPWGSLAGLLWFGSLHQLGVAVPVRRFVVVGATVTAVALPASLLLLTVLP